MVGCKFFLINNISSMDFISKRATSVPFVNDKSLWINALERKPGYDYLLGWDELMEQRGKHDTPEQAELRKKYSTREKYIEAELQKNVDARLLAIAAGGPPGIALALGGAAAAAVAGALPGAANRGAAIASWNAAWDGNPNKVQNYIMGSMNNDPWGVANNRDAYGNIINLAGNYEPRTVPPHHYQRRWLAAHPNYRAVGWRGNPNNAIIRRMFVPPAAAAAAAAAGPGAPPPAIAAPGGGIVPALPVAGGGIFG